MRKDDHKKDEHAKPQAFEPTGGQMPGYNPGMPYPGMELARVYIPIQRWGRVYTPVQALETGTLFPDLYRPYPY